jgi:hypothetical protein
MSAVPARRESMRDRDHRHDREVSAATYRAQRAREGRGYCFEIPEKARAA